MSKSTVSINNVLHTIRGHFLDIKTLYYLETSKLQTYSFCCVRTPMIVLVIGNVELMCNNKKERKNKYRCKMPVFHISSVSDLIVTKPFRTKVRCLCKLTTKFVERYDVNMHITLNEVGIFWPIRTYVIL